MSESLLHQTAIDADEAWGARTKILCACEAELELWDGKCPACKARNPFPKLQAKRARIEKCLDGRISDWLFPKLSECLYLLEAARQYDRMLQGVLERPFPEQQKKEELELFMRRVRNFFPAMFKASSPRKMALGSGDAIKRSAADMVRVAQREAQMILDSLLGSGAAVSGGSLEAAEDRLTDEQRAAAKPYIEALKTLQLGHSRMVAAYGPVKVIFERPVEEKGGRGLWNKARLKFKPVGDLLRLPTAMWRSDAEYQALKRFDAQFAKFAEQIRWFSGQSDKLAQRQARLMKNYSLSLRKHLLRGLVERYVAAEPAARPLLVKRVLSAKGVSSWLWRLFFGARR